MLIAPPSLFLSLVIEVLLLLSQDLIQSYRVVLVFAVIVPSLVPLVGSQTARSVLNFFIDLAELECALVLAVADAAHFDHCRVDVLSVRATRRAMLSSDALVVDLVGSGITVF